MPSQMLWTSVVRNQMFKILVILVFSIGSVLNCFSQKTVGYYKSVGDAFMMKQFDPEVFHEVSCISYLAKRNNDGSKRLAGDIVPSLSDTVSNMEWIGFFYDYYSPELGYTFHWYLTLDSDEKVGPEWMLVKTLPSCVRLKANCQFLNKEKAVAVAIADSLPHPDNYYVELVSPKKASEFYWAITGVDKREIDYSVKPKEGGNLPIPAWKRHSTRLVNAATGRITNLQEYYALDKD